MSKKLAHKLYIFQLFPNAPASRPPGTLPPSKITFMRFEWWRNHPFSSKLHPSHSHLKFQNLRFFINLRSPPPLPCSYHHGKNERHHLPSVFVLNHLYPILPMVPFDDIVWEQGQKASRHISKHRGNCMLSNHTHHKTWNVTNLCRLVFIWSAFCLADE